MLLLLAMAGLAPAQTPPFPDRVGLDGPQPEPTSVVGGDPAEPDAWPEVAALAYGSGFVACTGVLVHPEWVLTAGHCAPNIAELYLDTTDPEAPGEVLEVVEFIVHDDSNRTFDVALAHLAAPSAVAPAALALDCISGEWLRVGTELELVGFGKIDTSAQVNADVLMQATIPIVDPECVDPYRGCQVDAMPAGEFIAGGDGLDSCTGDSGAPTFLHAADRWWVAGITSRGAQPLVRPCGDGGIYVRLDAIDTWIEAVIGEPLPRPACDGLNLPPSLSIDAIETARNRPATAAVHVDEPDGQAWTLTLERPAEHGVVGLSDEEIVYVPHPDFVGSDSLRVVVTDAGSPPESMALDVPITVHAGPETAGCGCAHGQPAVHWILAILPLALLRRP